MFGKRLGSVWVNIGECLRTVSGLFESVLGVFGECLDASAAVQFY